MDNTVEVQELGKVMITPKGEYSLSKSYEILDAVSYNGSSYVSKINDNTSVPTSDDWQLLAQKGDIYDVTEEDLQAIAKQITDNANSTFNQNVKTKTKEFNTNATNKLNDYDTNSKSTTETFDANAKKKLDEYNANDTKKLKAYNDNADNKLSAYNTNDTNKLKAYNTNADSKIEEYNTNANSKILEYDKHSEELRNMAISTDNELERVKNEILDTGSASDSFIHVEDSCMAKIKELGVDGVCKQETTRGYNILDENSWKTGYHITGNSLNASNNGCHVDFQKIGSITQYFIRIEALKKCRIGRFFSAFTNESQDTSINKVSEGIYDTVFSAGQVKYITVNVPDGAFYVGFSIYLIQKIVNGEYVDVIPIHENYKDYFKICISTSYQENYEPFTNGASPNPDYPQEIKTITDGLKITSCGKNLFDVNDILENTAYSGIVGEKITTVVNTVVFAASVIKTNANSIRISSNKNDATFRIKLTDNNGIIGYDLGFTKLPQTIDTSKYKYIYIYFDKNTITTNNNIQIEIGDKETSFEKHIQSQITAKLPENEFIGKLDNTYKDTLRAEYFPEKRQYHWMLDKKVGKYVFTGNENWSIYTQSNGIPIFRCTLPASGVVVKSNYFVSQTTWPTLLEENRIFNHVGNYQNIEIACSKFDTLTNFKNILTTNVVQMYYGLKTPYTLDLGPIDMPLSYKGITNIFTDSDLLPKITAKYYRTFEKTILNMQINEKSLKQEITDLNNNISDITKRLEALESANVNTVEESEASNDLQN